MGRYSLQMDELLSKTRQAAKLLVSDLRNPPSVEDLCQLLGISEFKLKKGFRLHYDTTVGAYLRAKRMEAAADMLRSGDVTVESVAAAMGYSNASRFAEAFRKHHGCNPGEFVERA